ncbi:hypothetical protein Dimus_025091 [Dionaea muscipula]
MLCGCGTVLSKYLLPKSLGLLRSLLANLQEVVLSTKLSVLFPTIALAILAQHYNFDKPWIFGLSFLGLAPLAERVSFLTDGWTFECNLWKCHGADNRGARSEEEQSRSCQVLFVGINHLKQLPFGPRQLASLWRHN